MKIITAKLFAFVLSCVAFTSTLGAADYTYAKIDVPNSRSTYLRGINARGDLLGSYVDASGASHDFLLRDGIYKDVHYPGDAAAGALAMNARGDLVGNVSDADGGHGFLLRDGTLTKIDYPGASLTAAYGINNTGDITGSYLTSTGDLKGFILRSGRFSTVGIAGGVNVVVRGVEDNGQVMVGDVQLNSDLSTYGFRRGINGLHLMAPPRMKFPCSHARAINERGDVAGAFAIVTSFDECDSRPPAHGFVLRKGVYHIIDPPGSHDTFIFGINDDGIVVGAVTDDNGLHGFKAMPAHSQEK